MFIVLLCLSLVKVNMSFLKIKDNYPMLASYRAYKSIASYGKKNNDKFVGINYSSVVTPNQDKIFCLIPEKYRKHFYIALMEINTFIPPHVDTGVLSTINFYIEPDNCTTQFYKFKEEETERINTKGYVYKLSELDELEKFVAEKDSVYLLDTTVPHAVWDIDYEFIPMQMEFMGLLEDASIGETSGWQRRNNDEPMITKDTNGNVLKNAFKYRNTNRIALCLQSLKYNFQDVADMVESQNTLEVC